MSNKAIFLDRDDTLIEDTGYINNPGMVKLLNGVAEALIELKELGYKLIVVSNQSGVARGILTEETLGEIHNRLKELLAEQGASLDKIYYCPYHPDGSVRKYRKESKFRKPNPGMLLKASDEMDINLEQSWCVGNSRRDIEAGIKAGCKTVLLDSPSHKDQADQQLAPKGVQPDFRAVNMKEVVNIIKKDLRTNIETTDQIRVQNREQAKNMVKTAKSKSDIQEPIQTADDLQQPEQTQVPWTLDDNPGGKTEQLLTDILGQLKNMHRTEMFGEFSVMRLLAGIVQILVLFCLLITVWLLMSPNRQNSSVLIAIGLATVLQLMALTFYTMHGKK